MRMPAFDKVRRMSSLALAFVALAMPAPGPAQGRRIPTPSPFPQPQVVQTIQQDLPQQMKIRVEDDLATATLQNVPLQLALGEFAARTGIVFEVAQQENDPISVSFSKTSLPEAIQRILGPGNSIIYFGETESGRSRIQLVRVLTRTSKSAQASLRYIGTGTVTKIGEDAVDNPEQALKALAESKSVDARQKAVEVLVAAKGEAAVQAITTAVEDDAPEVRVAAIEGLASLHARIALPRMFA